MSSLMQFNGDISNKGVHLEAILVAPGKDFDKYGKGDEDTVYCNPVFPKVDCNICGKSHDQVHTFIRKPKGMLGCWVIFEYNGKRHVPDLSTPISIRKLPRDAKKLNVEENSKVWH